MPLPKPALATVPRAPCAPPVPLPINSNTLKGQLARDPSLKPRQRRGTELLSVIINSLQRQGYLQQTDRDTFKIVTGAIELGRDPVATDDASVGVHVGTLWVNTATQAVFINVATAPGASVWHSI